MEVPSILSLAIIAPIIFFGLYHFHVLYSYVKQLTSYVYNSIIFLFLLQKGGTVGLNVIGALEKMCTYNEKQGMFEVWSGKPSFVVFSPAFVKLLMNDPKVFEKPIHYDIHRCMIGDSLLYSNLERWKKQKKILKPAFHQAELKNNFSTFNKHSQKLVARLLNFENTDNVLDILKDSTLRVSLETFLGIEENSSFGTSFLLNLRENISRFWINMGERTLKVWLYPDFCLRIFPEGRKMLREFRDTYGSLQKVLEKLKNDMLSSKNDTVEMDTQQPKLLAETLIEAHLKDPSFTMDHLVKETIMLFAASYDTTAITCMWCLYLLGRHQDVQSRLHMELEMLQENPTFEDLRKMEYLECVLKESMRIYTTAPFISKCTSGEVKCGQCKIPKDTIIILALQVVHKNPIMFPDPEKFDPDRFKYTKEGCSERLYLAPFAEGVRPCMGKNYALYLLKIMVVHIIRNFKVISLDHQDDVKLFWSLTAQSAKPLRMQFIPRDTKPDVNIS